MIIYIIAPKKIKNTALLLGSLFFYAWGEPKYVILMLIEIAVTYVLGILIEKEQENFNNKNSNVDNQNNNQKSKYAKLYITFSVIFSLGILGYYKYADFFITSFNEVFGLDIRLLKVALPVGISFYTFQTLSYTIDVYRGEAKAQRSFVALATYIVMFPQLIAGPIVRYTDIEKELQSRTYDTTKIAYGIRRFVIGLGKKVIIANTLGEIVKEYGTVNDKTVLYAIIYAVCVSLQIYFDFSGYSDMAIGIGKMLGFNFPENFKHPFESKSATEFWRRWHITLGSWFRDYLYIPLGGNRVSHARHIINILIVWFATGMWHGAAWNFIVWGLYFAFFLVIEKYFLGKYLSKLKVVNHIYLCLIVMISFMIFDASSMQVAISNIKIFLGFGNVPFLDANSLYCLKNYGVLIIASIIGATAIPMNVVNKMANKKCIKTIIDVCEIIFILVIMIVSTAFLVSGSYNPFLYFRF